jgi:hypothetical protein
MGLRDHTLIAHLTWLLLPCKRASLCKQKDKEISFRVKYVELKLVEADSIILVTETGETSSLDLYSAFVSEVTHGSLYT